MKKKTKSNSGTNIRRLANREHKKAMAMFKEFKRTGKGGDEFLEQNQMARDLLVKAYEKLRP